MRRILKSVLCLVLVCILSLSTVMLSPNTVYADSNDRIATYINLAATGETTDGDTSGMTEDQLRFLGLYLSNFYIPFGTEIGTSGGELADTTKADMVETLQQKFAFSEELATSIVNTVFGYTRSSLKDVGIYVKKTSGLTKVDIAPNYYNFYRIMVGRSDDVLRKYTKGLDLKNVKTNGDDYDGKSTKTRDSNLDKVANTVYGTDYDDLSSSKKKSVTLIYEIICGKFGKFYFCYDNGTDIIPVCDATIGVNFYEDDGSFSYRAPRYDEDNAGIVDYSASQVAFMKCLEASNVEQGYGFSFMDFSATDGVDSEAIAELADSSSNTDKTKMSMLGATMAVDCFGDIITMGANHQVVVMPGCINPYVWTPVDKDGNEIDSIPAGLYYNIANAISMTQVGTESGSSNEFLTSCESGTSSIQGAKLFKANFAVLNNNLDSMRLGYSVSNTADGNYAVVGIRTQRGTSETKLNSGFLGLGGTSERDFFVSAIDGFKELYPNDLTYFYATSNASKSAGVVNDSWWNGTATYDCSVPRSKDLGGGDFYGASMRSKLNLLTNVVFVDNLGAYKTSDGQSLDFSTFNEASFVDDSGNTASEGSGVNFGTHSFGNMYSDIKTGELSVPYTASETALCTLYVTYCWAGLYDEGAKADTIGKLGYKMNIAGLPSMENAPLDLGDALGDGDNVVLASIQDWIYYLLHPTDGYDYVKILVTNKVNHLLLGWHNDMTGTNGVGITTGTTKYRSNMGYVTMPDLSEIKWTDALINLYNDCIPFLIIIILIMLIFAYITGVLDLQHSIIGLLVFSIFTVLPVTMINTSVEHSNRISQNIYGNKFTYWALVQQESYATAIDEAANSTGSTGTSSYDNYLRTLYSENQMVYSNQGGESILLKWQAPKKMASLVLTESDAKSLDGLNDVGQQMMSGMLNKSYSGQSYTEDEDAVYMYRSYLDISNFSRYIYQGIKSGTVKKKSGFTNVNTDNWVAFRDSNGAMIKTETDFSNEYTEYIDAGYLNGTNFGQETSFSEQFYLTVPMSSDIIGDTLSVYGTLDTFTDTSSMIPINSDVFNFGIPMFTNNTVGFSADTFAATGFITDAKRKSELSTYMGNYTEEDFVGLAAYGLYSENPYYYFSWKLYADGLDSNSSLSNSAGYKKLLLGEEDGGFFYNTEGNGGLKDFMNMKGLFTYIIPYMKQCNDIVRDWDDVFGVYVHEGIPTEEGHWDDITDPELQVKYWHNLNVTRLYDIYCPWVDVMYDCSYAEPETISVMGRKVVVDDPLNPNCYPADRPMIFSESEMSDYGLTEADLTKVEKLILDCNEQYQERMYELLNYYNFSDVSLNSAAAMNCAFVFNNTFSENGIFTDNHNIYPQSFDLANFSYDAFLRFILSNATEESMLDVSTSTDTVSGATSGDFYERVVNNSSVVTVLVMLVLDVLSIYVIPAFRIFFLIAIFLVSVLIILVSVFNIEDSMKFGRKVLKQFFTPLALFFLATILFSFIVSLFMGVGNNSVTQTNTVDISMGDPVITMLLMVALDVILLIVYWHILKMPFADIKHNAKLVGGFATSLASSVAGFATGAIMGGLGAAKGMSNSISNGIRNRRMDKFLKKGTDVLEHAQEGTGVENPRANTRGSTDGGSNSEDEGSNSGEGARNPSDFDKGIHRPNNEGTDTPEETDAKREAIDEKSSSASGDLETRGNVIDDSHSYHRSRGDRTRFMDYQLGKSQEGLGRSIDGAGNVVSGSGTVVRASGQAVTNTGDIISKTGGVIKNAGTPGRVIGTGIDGLGNIVRGSGKVTEGVGRVSESTGETISRAGQSVQRSGNERMSNNSDE